MEHLSNLFSNFKMKHILERMKQKRRKSILLNKIFINCGNDNDMHMANHTKIQIYL